MPSIAQKILAKKWLGKLKLRRRKASTHFNRQEYRVFSQHREDGIIDYLLNTIGDDIGRFVEFGFAPDQCNCINLAINRGFSGLFIDGNATKCNNAITAFKRLALDNVMVKQAFIERERLNSLIADCGIEGEIDVLSIDVDGNDYWFWQAVEVIDPRIVVIEYNASFGSQESVSIPYQADFVRYRAHPSGFYHGCSLAAIEHLGRAKGYRLLGVDETGVNAFLVKHALCSELETKSAAQCFKDNRGRVKYKKISREKQRKRIADMPLVDVTSET